MLSMRKQRGAPAASACAPSHAAYAPVCALLGMFDMGLEHRKQDEYRYEPSACGHLVRRSAKPGGQQFLRRKGQFVIERCRGYQAGWHA